MALSSVGALICDENEKTAVSPPGRPITEKRIEYVPTFTSYVFDDSGDMAWADD